MTTYAINGIGRIGKYVLKFLLEKNLDLAWINDAVGAINTHCHLLEFDTVHGRWNAKFSCDQNIISIDDRRLIFNNHNKIENLDIYSEFHFVFFLKVCKINNYV